MLKEQIANNGWQPLKVGLPKRSHVPSTNEEEIPDVNESSQDKGKRKVAEVPRINTALNRPTYEGHEQTGWSNVFARLGGRVTQNEAQPKNWAKQDLRK